MTSRWADEDVEEDEELITQPAPTTAPAPSGKISYSAFSRPAATRPKPTGLGVVVRGLDEGTTESQVSRFFAACGSDISIRLSKGKGIAFVEVKSKTAMDKALSLDGFRLGKKIVQVSADSRRPERSEAPRVQSVDVDDADRPKLNLLPRSDPAPGFESLAAPGFETHANKAAIRLLRKKAEAAVPKPKAAPKQNRFAGLNSDDSEESEEEDSYDEEE